MAKIIIAFALLQCSLVLGTKITPELQKSFTKHSSIDTIITLKESVSSVLQNIQLHNYKDHDAKRVAIYEELKDFTSGKQREILKFLDSRASNHQSVVGFWVTNKISVRSADLQLLEELESRFADQISEIRAGYSLEPLFIRHDDCNECRSERWNINQIRAPETWALGYNGTNITVASSDTGVRYTHEALISNYRSDYGWFDPYDHTITPNDTIGSGTHNMGVMVGSHGIGVAPGANWIACKACSFSCSEFALLGCGQWAICPTTNGSQPDCSKAPRVMSHSWGGAGGNPFYNDVLSAMVEANIVPLFPVGGSGPGCGTVGSPADQRNAAGVGAIGVDTNMTSFSSRGPTSDGRVKPDIVAPGASIYSAWLGDSSYTVLSGSSSANVHIGGAVAVVLSKNSSLTVSGVMRALYDSAWRPQMDSIPCNGTELWPNNYFGHGLLDVYSAVNIVS